MLGTVIYLLLCVVGGMVLGTFSAHLVNKVLLRMRFRKIRRELEQHLRNKDCEGC